MSCVATLPRRLDGSLNAPSSTWLWRSVVAVYRLCAAMTLPAVPFVIDCRATSTVTGAPCAFTLSR